MTLDDLKNYLRVDTSDEDADLARLLAAAIAAVTDYLDRPVYDTQEALDTATANSVDTTDAIVITAPIEAAILLQAGDLYANRERVSTVETYPSDTYERLLAPYRKATV